MGAPPRLDLVAVSTNPAIDRVAVVDGPGRGIVRASELLETAGGKAIHVACVAAELGAETAVITTAGGRSGDQLLELLASEPVDVHPVPVAASTRGTYTVVRAGEGELIEVHEPSGSLTEGECDRLVSRLAAFSTPTAVAICGSLPPDAPPDLHARLVAAARERRAFTILDCSSPEPLAAALAEGPDLVAPNLAEAERLLGSELDPGADQELVGATDAIRDRGAGAVWLSMGPAGSVFADAEGATRLTAPEPTQPINTVGCGDALIGGLVAGMIAGHELRAAAALGVAAATDKLAHLHPGRVDRSTVERLVALVEATALRREATVS